ncbi:MAG: GDSL-type esterase/lipase family protein [Prevotellaceae bacterium]|jgi:lysophospholipase L1-like esterase|nr:GDSL-type esterase/lipase family protein [Prevotellaceae bacterium]
MKGRIFIKLVILLLVGFPTFLSAQQRPSFVIESLNIIHDETGSLNKLFELLYLQKQHKGTTTIPFLHIGDSHIQAGFLTRVMRTNLQREFGNAGLGLVIPLKIAGTNQPRDYRITSDGDWENGRMATRSKGYTFGISGITIQTTDKNVSLNIEARYDSINNLSYRFNKITVFHDNAPTLTTRDSSKFTRSERHSPHTYSLYLTNDTTLIQLQQRSTGQEAKTIYAFSLENGEGGILYHTVGVNGARCRDFCNALLLIEQTQQLRPQAIIISLGTNESIETPCSIRGFLENLDRLVKGLRKANQSAVFILTTPAENFRRYQRKRIPNDRIILIRDAVVEYAAVNNIAYWDLFEATGGKGSNEKWKQNGLMGRDQIHFSIEGYELQGQLFFDAFMKLYNTYVGEHRLE